MVENVGQMEREKETSLPQEQAGEIILSCKPTTDKHLINSALTIVKLVEI